MNVPGLVRAVAALVALTGCRQGGGSDALRRGQYTPELWTRYAGQDLDALWAEFQAALGRK